MTTTLKIKNLRLHAIVGINPEERVNKQDVIVNVSVDYDASQAVAHDDIRHALDYKTLTKRIIRDVASTQYFLLERLNQHILDIVMSYENVASCTVEVDKPLALRFADSISSQQSAIRKG